MTVSDLLDSLRARFGLDITAAASRYCHGCETRTSATARCPVCGQRGELASAAPSWWVTRATPEAVEPRRPTP